jgi:hypothetical protein
MQDTIRQYVKRRVRWCTAVGVSGWLMLPLGAAVARSLPDAIPQGAIPVVGALVFFGAILTLQWLVKCPQCRANLGRTVAMPIAFSWGSGPKVNYCPYCGVQLDRPVPGHEPVAQSQNPIHPA